MNPCLAANKDMSVQEMVNLIKSSPPGPWPDKWATWENTIEAHRQLNAEFIENYTQPNIEYPQKRGIVICGGGLRYFPSIWVNVNMIRHFGCDLPIQVWYLGTKEFDPSMKRLLAPFNVEFVDCREMEAKYPCRILCGWESKLYSTLYSPFEEVLFLDADNAPVRDVTYLFDLPQYREHGAIFWPDYAEWTLKHDVWSIFGITWLDNPEAKNEKAFESGQYLINKKSCHKELALALHIAEHSDFTFKHVYGDKECFHLAWRRLRKEYAIPNSFPGWNLHTIIQYDFDHNIVFQHRCQDKFRLGGHGNKKNLSLCNEELAFRLLSELQELWDGVPWSNNDPNPFEKAEYNSLRNRFYLYKRVGYDERVLELGDDNRVGQGKAECEERWWVHQINNEFVLTISRLDRPTCHLKKCSDGVWRGSWIDHEKMPIELREMTVKS